MKSSDATTYRIEEALRAQSALRKLAGLGPEQFPLRAFVGMISDEIETLREQDYTDEQIARTIEANSNIGITAAEITENYATAEERHQEHAQTNFVCDLQDEREIGDLGRSASLGGASMLGLDED